MRGADLAYSQVWEIDLNGADLSNANLRGAEFRQVQARAGTFVSTVLKDTEFLFTDFTGSDFAHSRFGHTHLSFCTLKAARGLDTAEVEEPCHCDPSTVAHSAPLPEQLVCAFGLSREYIELNRALMHGKQHAACFLSYSRMDETTVGRVHSGLIRRHVPVWYAPSDLRHERDLERDLLGLIDSAECVLLMVSPHILPSVWVHKELERALSQEQRGRTTIIPIYLADLPTSEEHWRAHLLARRGSDIDVSERGRYDVALRMVLSRGAPLDLRATPGSPAFEGTLDWLGRLLKLPS